MTLRTLVAFGLALLCLALAPAHAADAATPPPGAKGARPKIALVLSGGGARGFAHVGVLRALEEAQVPVDFIVGTSMGAIIGGLYASGMRPDELDRELKAVDWGGIFDRREPRQLLSQRRKEEDFAFSPMLQMGFRDGEFRLPTGAVSTRSLEMLLRRYTLLARDLKDFDGLPTPFRALATDMETGQPVVISQGDLAAALRASMSVPGVFSPLEVNGRILGDGGLVDNLPVAVARKMGADVVIAVNIGTPLARRNTLSTALGVTAQMINILTEQNVLASKALLAPGDLLLNPDLGEFSSADFNQVKDLVDLGYTYGVSVRQAMNRFSAPAPVYAQWLAQRERVHTALTGAANTINAVRFEGVSEARAQKLRAIVDLPMGRVLNIPAIEAQLQELAATGDYDRVDYRLQRGTEGDGESLLVQLKENEWGPNYLRLGMDLRTEFEGRSAFNLRLSHNRHWLSDGGTEWRNHVQLGENLALGSEIYQPWSADSRGFSAAYVDAEVKRLDLYNLSGALVATGRRQGIQFGADIGWPLDRLGRFGDLRVGVFAALRRAVPELVSGTLETQGATLSPLNWREIGLRAKVTSDQLDHANFPASGYRTETELVLGHLTNEGKRTGFSRLNVRATTAQSSGPHTLNIAGRVGLSSQVPTGAIDEYALGGFQQLSGYRVGQVAGNYLLFGRASYYYRLPWNVSVARGLFAGASIEAGNAWASRGDISLKRLRSGNSLFIGADTGMGPLYLSLVSAPRGYTGLYLFLGRP